MRETLALAVLRGACRHPRECTGGIYPVGGPGLKRAGSSIGRRPAGGLAFRPVRAGLYRALFHRLMTHS
jgi:hypothetical protein